ncbi:MAG TPA: hypothetical protein VL625_05290 [Patescibacteria group bacterium]|jgi:hypothetical protein|nr:hypothetical protein [Patescibacteria group bacterium]
MKKTLMLGAALALISFNFPVAPAHADDSALGQASDAADSGAAAASASSDETAKSESNQGFDTAQPPVVDTRTPSEGGSGLSNAPTYDPNSGSGLDNAPTPPAQ